MLLFREERTLSEKMEIVFIVGTPIALGVLARHWVHNFYAADIAFVGAILMGVIGGRLVGTAGGTKFGYEKDGKPFLTKDPKLLLNDNNAGKPEGIHLMIGRRPYAAFGNRPGTGRCWSGPALGLARG